MRARAAEQMGGVKIPYYVVKGGRKPGTRRMGYWAPCLARPNKKTGVFEPTLMAKLGFAHVECGEDGPRAWALAQSWNEKWKAARAAHLAGAPIDTAAAAERIYPPGSVGEAFAKFRGTATWRAKKERTREDWERGWKLIEPVFGDLAPRAVDLVLCDRWYAELLGIVGVREAHRAMKIWRALWKVISTIRAPSGASYCEKTADPSLGVRRKAPAPRQAIWYEGEAVRLVKRAWRMNYRGLAAALAVAWDTMLSPVDVRSLTRAQLSGDADGPLFQLARAKTGKAAIGTVSPRTQRLLSLYLAELPALLHPDAPIFRTPPATPISRKGRPGEWGGNHGGGTRRAPVPYAADVLSKHFRAVRAAEFPGDRRTLMDFRRSGAVEAKAGEVNPMALADKMANTIDNSRALQNTYLPPNAKLVRLADAARARGRARLRGGRGGK